MSPVPPLSSVMSSPHAHMGLGFVGSSPHPCTPHDALQAGEDHKCAAADDEMLSQFSARQDALSEELEELKQVSGGSGFERVQTGLNSQNFSKGAGRDSARRGLGKGEQPETTPWCCC